MTSGKSAMGIPQAHVFISVGGYCPRDDEQIEVCARIGRASGEKAKQSRLTGGRCGSHEAAHRGLDCFVIEHGDLLV